MSVLLLTMVIVLGMVNSMAPEPHDGAVPAPHTSSTEHVSAPPQLTDLEIGEIIETIPLLHDLSTGSTTSNRAIDRIGDVAIRPIRTAVVEMGLFLMIFPYYSSHLASTGSRIVSSFRREIPFFLCCFRLGYCHYRRLTFFNRVLGTTAVRHYRMSCIHKHCSIVSFIPFLGRRCIGPIFHWH